MSLLVESLQSQSGYDACGHGFRFTPIVPALAMVGVQTRPIIDGEERRLD